MVLGNHDYFNRSLITAIEDAREIAEKAVLVRNEIGGIKFDDNGDTISYNKIYILDDNSELKVRSQNVRFIGSTLWTDFAIHSPADAPGNVREAYRQQAISNLQGKMPEYELTSFGSRMMSPYDAYASFQNSKKALIEKLATSYSGKTVVLTHHAPHRNSISKHFGMNNLTPAFVSDMSDVIEEFQPSLWIHGHVHENFDYQVGQTRVFCHPRGNGNPDFSWSIGVIELQQTKEFA